MLWLVSWEVPRRYSFTTTTANKNIKHLMKLLGIIYAATHAMTFATIATTASTATTTRTTKFMIQCMILLGVCIQGTCFDTLYDTTQANTTTTTRHIA